MHLVVRYRIEDAKGYVLTEEGYFSSEPSEAITFRSAASAQEQADEFPGATVERFEHMSKFADLTFTRHQIADEIFAARKAGL